jgi:hypothetical protein
MKQHEVGDRITGRCVTMGTAYEGAVAEVLQPVRYSGQYGPRYRLVDTGQFYSNGKAIEPIVE